MLLEAINKKQCSLGSDWVNSFLDYSKSEVCESDNIFKMLIMIVTSAEDRVVEFGINEFSPLNYKEYLINKGNWAFLLIRMYRKFIINWVNERYEKEKRERDL